MQIILYAARLTINMNLENRAVSFKDGLLKMESSKFTSRGSGKSRQFTAVKEFLCCDLNGNSVILNMTSGKYFGINSVGSFIWAAIQTPKTFEEIVGLVLDEFDVDDAVCIKEVSAFLEKMSEQELVLISDD